ncbi:MAG: hypothetical protein V2I47_08405 [Bacteroidales bacterium]|nr:hypothetical protein [Bacteroidales bacterium]
MKPITQIVSLVLMLIFMGCSNQDNQVRHSKEIQPYVDFLKNENTSAKDYIISLFEKNDVVIICERLHPELTQYDLILDICKDPRFINNIGNVFIEVCGRKQADKIDHLLNAVALNENSVNRLITDITRNCSFHPLWTNYNFPYLLRGLYEINKDLDHNKKIHLYPTDLPHNWKNMDSTAYKVFWDAIRARDKKMADYIIAELDTLSNDGKRNKALVIMNYRHAFGNNFMYNDSIKPDNVGRYLFEHYPGKVANVLVNSIVLTEVRSDSDVEFGAIQEGKWDASFHVLNKYDLGFDLRNSPFGKDYFDTWIFTEHNYSYGDVFNGFVYYKPIQEFKMAVGVPGLIDSAFLSELKRRNAIANKVRGSGLPLIDSILWQYNETEITNDIFTDSVKYQISKWVK